MSAMQIPSQCGACKHFKAEYVENPDAPPDLCDSGNLKCDAFPEWPGIPWEIQAGEFDHAKSYPGDHGIHYEEAW